MATYSERWEAAKDKFETATGVKKPKPTGVFKEFFNYTSLSRSMSDVDKLIMTYDSSKPDAKAKQIPGIEKKVTAMSTGIDTYLKVLEASAKDEKADQNAKTAIYRELKVLSAELKAIKLHAKQKVDGEKVSQNTALSGVQKAGAMMKASLASACANANLALKSAQADPTPATFNKFFKKSDSPGRKVQVQLVTAANQLAKGALPAKDTDPRHIADMYTAWQSESSPNNSFALTATRQQVLARIEDFKKILKLAQHYSDSL